ncbi:hypothetical protein IEQ34_012352 [Dendrobium chrysotoxum]|uniref:Uncharacterized protein n=1 Tax=Dendrobium chrysotoxum TaxID=161865 RepID=A0AAV7GV55_DENCH|nr:hypothetical protein IEQ34_012352 [Dendrobium chrysotoxum]
MQGYLASGSITVHFTQEKVKDALKLKLQTDSILIYLIFELICITSDLMDLKGCDSLLSRVSSFIFCFYFLARGRNLHHCVVKTFTLIYVPRTSATLLEINGVKIPPKKLNPIILRRDRLVEAESDTEVMFDVNFHGEKSVKGIFQRDVRWGLECELFGLNMWMQIGVVTDQGVLIRDRKLSVIQEEDEEEMVESNYLKYEHGIDNGNEVNLRNRLTKTFTLVYVPRTSATLLEINGAKIPPNKPAPIVLRRDRLVEAESDTEVVYASTDQINFGGEKSLKGIFQRDVRWGLECELIGLNMLMQISVVSDQGVLIRERVKLRRNRFCQKLSVIQEDDEEEMVESNYLKHEHGINDGNEVGNKGVSWAINIGILVASLGVGLFIFRAPLKRLVR